MYTVASKQMLISFAPPVLTLHLKRFQQARFTLRKLTKHVDFPLELNLAPFCSKSGKVSQGRWIAPRHRVDSFVLGDSVKRQKGVRGSSSLLDLR